jgi:hypothetical protein
VDGVDRGLELVRARLVAAQAGAHQRLPLIDQGPVPPRPVLVGEQHDRAVIGEAGRLAGLSEEQERQVPGDLGLVGISAAMVCASRIASWRSSMPDGPPAPAL